MKSFNWAGKGKLITILLFLCILLASQPAAAQNQPLVLVIDQVITTDFPSVEALVSIFDRNGIPAAGISSDQVTLSEDGTAVADFTLVEDDDFATPLAVALLIDTSGSMGHENPSPLDNAVSAARGFINKLDPQDSIGIISFNQDVTVQQELTRDKVTAKAALGNLKAEGDTSLYDALNVGVEMLQSSGKKNLIILITDGVDSGTSEASLGDALAAAGKAHIPVYPLGFGEINEDRLTEIAETTGAFVQINPSSQTLPEDFDRILDQLRHVYRITYTSNLPANDSVHQLTVGLDADRVTYEDQFDFIPKPLTVLVNAPQPGEILDGSTPVTAQVGSTSPIESVAFSASGQVLQTLTQPTQGEDIYEIQWNIADLEPGEYEIQVRGVDEIGNHNETLVPVTVRPMVAVTIVNPTASTDIRVSTDITVEVDSVLEIASGTVLIDNEPWASFTEPQFSQVWRTNDMAGGNHIIKVEVADVAGNTGEDEVIISLTASPLAIGSGVAGSRFFLYGGIGVAVLILLMIVMGFSKKKRPAHPVSGSLAPTRLALHEVTGVNPGKVWPLANYQVRLGRNLEESDIPLQGLKASRRMAVIRRADNAHLLYPLNPENPVFINKNPVHQQAQISPGDEILMGESVFTVIEK